MAYLGPGLACDPIEGVSQRVGRSGRGTCRGGVWRIASEPGAALRVVDDPSGGSEVFFREKKCSPPRPGLAGGAPQSCEGIPPPARQTANAITRDRRRAAGMRGFSESRSVAVGRLFRIWAQGTLDQSRSGRIGKNDVSSADEIKDFNDLANCSRETGVEFPAPFRDTADPRESPVESNARPAPSPGVSPPPPGIAACDPSPLWGCGAVCPPP